jgi:hypothetical protein
MVVRRRKVMADWAAFLAGESESATGVPLRGQAAMILIAITAEAYAAIAETIPVGSVAARPQTDDRGR